MFLALTPDASLTEKVQAYKNRVKEFVGEQVYLDHPPHLTLFVAVFHEPETIVDAARRLASEIVLRPIGFSQWRVFYDDPLTGGNTLALDIADADVAALRRVQHLSITHVADLRNRRATEQRLEKKGNVFDEEQQHNIEKFGFPYIGDGWLPHVTVASIESAKWPVVRETILAHPPHITASFAQLSVYRLVDETPDLLGSFSVKHQCD